MRGPDGRPDEELQELIATVEGPILSSIRLRLLVADAIVSLAALPFHTGLVTKSPEQLLAEWQGKGHQGSSKDSGLALILEFLQAFAKVKASSDRAFEEPTEDATVILQLSEEGSLEASLASAYSLAEDMSAWPCIKKIRSLATGSLQLVANLFAEALHLDNAVLSGDTPWPAATTTAKTLKGFVMPLKNPGAKDAAKALAKKPRDAKAWPAEDQLVAGYTFRNPGALCHRVRLVSILKPLSETFFVDSRGFRVLRDVLILGHSDSAASGISDFVLFRSRGTPDRHLRVKVKFPEIAA